MQVLIVGDGKVGFTLAEQLSAEDHDITIVDSDADALRKALERLDVMCVRGNGASAQVLSEAGVEDADLFIAVTSSDELNMICCLRAHKMGAKRIIARIRNPEYSTSEDFIREDIGIHLAINPEFSAAAEIARLLRFPHAVSMETFARGRVEMIEFALKGDEPLIGKPLLESRPHIPARILIGVAERNHESFIPAGDYVPQAGDHIYVVGEPAQMLFFAKYIRQTGLRVRSVMIGGGSRIAFYLARMLLASGMSIRIIELDEERCEELAEILPEAIILHGDATDEILLSQERLAEMDAYVALTDSDEENILAALHALDEGVPKVVAKVTRRHYARLADGVSMISPKDLIADRIVSYVRSLQNSEGSFVEQLYRIVGGQVELLEFTAQAGSLVVGKRLKEMRLKRGMLIAAIVRGQRIIIPYGDDHVEAGDTVIVVARGGMIDDLSDVVAGI